MCEEGQVASSRGNCMCQMRRGRGPGGRSYKNQECRSLVRARVRAALWAYRPGGGWEDDPEGRKKAV